jgi:RNA-binding protein 5/10
LCHIGQSRGFAFAQFVDIPDARRFLDQHYPSVPLHGTYDPNNAAPAEPTKIRIAYSRERDDRDKAGKSDDDWKCDVVGFPTCVEVFN